MKAYDYGFLSAIAATVLGSAIGVVWLSAGSSPVQAVAAEAAPLEPTAASEPMPAGLALALSPPAAIRVHGVVMGPSGDALAGVRVRPEADLAPETLTGPDGRYELLLRFDPGTSLPALRFLAAGYEDGRAVLALDASVTEADVRLESRRPRTVVSGRVIGRGGEPVADEQVELESDQLGLIHTGRTGRDGRFFIPDVAVADDYELRIRPRGPYLQLWQFPLEATASGLDLELVLEPAPATRATSTAFLD